MKDLESLGIGVASILTLLDVNDLDGTKISNLANLIDNDLDSSFSSGSKKIQVQTLLNQHSSEIKVSDLKNCFKDASKAAFFLSTLLVVV